MSHMVRNTVIGLAALVAVSAGPAMAQEQGKLDEVLARGHLIVGTGSTNAPWHFKDESGNLVGFDIDIAKIVAKGLFGDDDQDRVRAAGIGRAHSQRHHRQGRHHLPVHDRDRGARAAGGRHHPLLPRRRRPADSGRWQAARPTTS